MTIKAQTGPSAPRTHTLEHCDLVLDRLRALAANSNPSFRRKVMQRIDIWLDERNRAAHAR